MRLYTTPLILIVLSIILSACGSPHERANDYAARARILLEKGDYVSARIEALNAIQIEEGNAEARYLLARIAEHNRNLLQSVYHLRIAIESDPNHVLARLNLGNLYYLAKFPDASAEQLQALLELAPNNAEVRTLSARILYQRGNFSAAEKEIEYALQRDPQLIGAIIFKAGLLMNLENIDAALTFIDESIDNVDFEAALPLRQFRIMLLHAADRNDEVEAELKTLIRDFPDRENFALNLARLYASQDMINKTEAIIQSLIDKYPNDMDRRVSYIQFIAENRGLDEAIDALRETIIEFPDQLILRLLLGRLYEATEATDQALATYREIASRSPTSKHGIAARNRIAAYLINTGEPAKARQVIEAILADEVNNTEALLARASFKFSAKNFDSAIGDLRIVLRTNETSEHALLLLARSHIQTGNSELADNAYRRLLRVNPRHPSAAIELADLHLQNGNSDSAANILRQQQELLPNNRDVASALIGVLLERNELDAAETIARQLIATNDPSGLAEFQLGRILEAKQSDSEAIAAYTLALEKDPDAEPPMLGIVNVYVSNEEYDEAIKFLETLLARQPAQMIIKFLIGNVYLQKGDSKAAERQFETVIAEHPDSIRSYLALVDLHANDPEARIRLYQRAQEANPGNEAINMLLAVEYQQNSYYEDAIALYENILEADTDNDLVANNLAVLLLDYRSDADSYARALQLAKRFSSSTHAAVIDTLGWAYYRNGELENAIRYLEVAVNMADKTPSMHYHLGMAYFSRNNVAKARENLQKSIVLAQAAYPGIEEARKTLNDILTNPVS